MFGQLGAGGGFSSLGGKRPAMAAPLTIPAGAAVITSARRLSTWNGNYGTVIRTSDSATLDIGFKNNIVDTAAMTTFKGASTLAWTKLYDQSGNGNDLTAATAQRPSADPSVYGGAILDSVVNNATPNPVKLFTIPAGVAINENSCSIFLSAFPKYAVNENSYFSFNTSASATWLSAYSQKNATGQIAGQTVGLTGGASPTALFGVNNIPSQNGVVYELIGNGTSGTITVDGVTTATAALVSQALTGPNYLGYVAKAPLEGSAWNIGAFIVYSSPLSGTDQTALRSAMQSAANIPTSFTSQIITDGDSISACIGMTLNRNWPTTLMGDFPGAKVINLGYPGQTMASLNTAASARVASRFIAGMKNICTIWAGTNDIVVGAAAATVYGNLQAYTSTVKAAGFKVVWVTMLPRTDLTATPQTVWTAYNALITGATLGLSNTADAIADVQANATMGPFAAASDHTLYCATPGVFTVGVHPTDLGMASIYPIIKAAVASL